MRKAFTLQRALLRFSVALLLVASFTCATSVMAITEVSGLWLHANVDTNFVRFLSFKFILFALFFNVFFQSLHSYIYKKKYILVNKDYKQKI